MEIWHKRIKQLRENTGVTLKEMGDLIGVSEATVQRYESGRIKELPYNVIEQYSKKFDVSPSYIMGWTDQKGEKTVPPLTDISRTYYVKDKYELSNEEVVVLEAYRKCPDTEKDMVKRMLRYDEELNKRMRK